MTDSCKYVHSISVKLSSSPGIMCGCRERASAALFFVPLSHCAVKIKDKMRIRSHSVDSQSHLDDVC